MSSFSERIKGPLKDHSLHTAINRATEQLKQRRIDAFSSPENFDLIKESLRNAKLKILSALDKNLLEFEKRLTENGANVHWAETGAEACEIVSKIASNNNARRIVKSKSMVTEEIELNAYLEKQDLRVIETDLGEYIVQLADDRPSHIVAPILHMTRERVGKIMQEKLGIPYTDDIDSLTSHAREKLRAEFIKADIGITGANCGVVDTGTICLVTNEGNGRMVTSLPKTHIVIMGIEKLLPEMNDMNNMIKLLARSATGQKISVYTTLINGPKKNPEYDGPEEMHVILLDNGRTKILNSGQAEILCCIRCGACLNACPVYNSVGGHSYGGVYAGPVGSVLTPCLDGIKEYGDLAFASSLCGACMEVCPVKIDIPGMLVKLRNESNSVNKPRIAAVFAKLFSLIAVNPLLYRFVRTLAANFLNISAGKTGRNKYLDKLFSGWTSSRELKLPAKKSFQDMWKEKSK